MAEFNNINEELKLLKPGDHICSFYSSKAEQMSVIVPFMLLGLKDNEKCIYIADENSVEELISEFKKNDTDIQRYLDTKKLEFLTSKESYLKGGYFEPGKMIELLKQAESQALKDSYTSLRVSGEMTWVFTNVPDIDKLIEYEVKLNYVLPISKTIAICQYNEDKFDPETLVDLIRVHPKVIIRVHICDNHYYIHPDEALAIISGNVTKEHYNSVVGDILQTEKEKRNSLAKEREFKLEQALSNEELVRHRNHLEDLVKERAAEIVEINQQLNNKIIDLERFQKLAVDRELKMIELKNKIKELEKRL